MKKIIYVVMALMLAFTQPGYAIDVWNLDEPTGARNVSDLDYYLGLNFGAIDRLLAGHRQGMKIKYDTVAQTVVQSGEITVSDSTGATRIFLRNTADTTVTWSNLDASSETASTTYYIYAIATVTTDTTATFKISTNSSAPAGVTYYKRIGSFYNDGSSNITLVKNDDTEIAIETSTVGHTGTIALPSGYAQDQCRWIVSPYYPASGNGYGISTFSCTASTSRVVSCSVTDTESSTFSVFANAIIACYR